MSNAIDLWPDLPASRGGPRLVPYLNPASTGKALVMVCPGGSYAGLADHEGEPIARRLNAAGFHAAVLHYRLGPTHRHPAMIHDAQRGIRLIRARAGAWGVHPNRVAVLGFSAGGHLASTLATHYDDFTSPDDDLAPSHSARPDAAVLCYPVIDMGEFRHDHSRLMLLGDTPDPALVEKLSNHKAVGPTTPPTFLWHTADDDPVPVQNSLLFAAACRSHRVPVELHVYDSGQHGLGLAADHPTARTWPDHCAAFLSKHLAAV